MKYFLDTEFVEGTQKKTFLGFNIGETKPTIDLISIGIVAEDDREYYAISKEFNLKEAWNKFDEKIVEVDYGFNTKSEVKKVYWLRENVLYHIFWEIWQKENSLDEDWEFGNIGNFMHHMERSGKAYEFFERLLLRHGKTNKEIAQEVENFCKVKSWHTSTTSSQYPHGFTKSKTKYFDEKEAMKQRDIQEKEYQEKPGGFGCKLIEEYDSIEFYADYCSYDWVVFCWLFGKMINLPPVFPMFCNDIQQIYHQKNHQGIPSKTEYSSLKNHPDYPKQDNTKKHHALEDARYDRDLYNFLNAF